MSSTYCPECDTEIQMSKNIREGSSITCKSCGAYLQVISLYPFELDWEDIDDDIDNDDFEFDDDG
jgi:lysine biosynthesis protein LysW